MARRRGQAAAFTIRLAPWAAATAKELHQQFGDDIELTVGALPYPPGRQPPRPPAAGPPPDLLDPHEIAAWLADPAVVSSGHTLQHGLLRPGVSVGSALTVRRRTPGRASTRSKTPDQTLSSDAHQRHHDLLAASSPATPGRTPVASSASDHAALQDRPVKGAPSGPVLRTSNDRGLRRDHGPRLPSSCRGRPRRHHPRPR